MEHDPVYVIALENEVRKLTEENEKLQREILTMDRVIRTAADRANVSPGEFVKRMLSEEGEAE